MPATCVGTQSSGTVESLNDTELIFLTGVVDFFDFLSAGDEKIGFLAIIRGVIGERVGISEDISSRFAKASKVATMHPCLNFTRTFGFFEFLSS